MAQNFFSGSTSPQAKNPTWNPVMILENLETMRSPMFIRFVWGAGIATPYTQVHIHIDTHTHQHIYAPYRATMALELAALICTNWAPRVVQTHQVGRASQHSKPHCYPHITAGHHRIQVGLLTTLTNHLPTQIGMKHLHMTDQFT